VIWFAAASCSEISEVLSVTIPIFMNRYSL
jgi:hypothetical protein